MFFALKKDLLEAVFPYCETPRFVLDCSVMYSAPAQGRT